MIKLDVPSLSPVLTELYASIKSSNYGLPVTLALSIPDSQIGASYRLLNG